MESRLVDNKQAQPSQQGPSSVYGFSFHGQGGSLFGLMLKNGFLTSLTLGIYSFWASVNLRKYFWSNFEFNGQRFSYHGTGKELFLGYLKLIGIFAVVFGVPVLGTLLHPVLGGILGVAAALSLVLFVPYAKYSAWRYRASRTAWRGIRFGMDDRAIDYIKLLFTEAFFTGLTLGIRYPIMSNRLYAFRVNNTYWGSLRMRYTGDDKKAFWDYWKAAGLCIITLGIYAPFYLLNKTRWRLQNTWIGNAQLGAAHANTSLGVWSVVWELIKVEFLVVASLGIAFPWAMCMLARFVAANFSFQGQIAFDKVEAVESKGDALGDSMAAVVGG